MSTTASPLESLRRLQTLYSQGYQSDLMDRALRQIIDQEVAGIRHEQSLIAAELAVFEQQYDMTSAQFQERFDRGALGDEADFFQWSALNGMAQSLAVRLRVLESGS